VDGIATSYGRLRSSDLLEPLRWRLFFFFPIVKKGRHLLSSKLVLMHLLLHKVMLNVKVSDRTDSRSHPPKLR
jgi:hypothetical protein